MTNSIPLEPTVTISTAYKVAQNPPPVVLRYSQAQQPVCQQTGVNQTATPDPSPSR